MPDVDDIALLREYVEHNSEFAFAGIVDLRFVRETELLDFSSGDDALADFCGVSTGGLIGNFTKLYLRHFDVQINPIKLTILNRLGKKLGAVFNHLIFRETGILFSDKIILTR